MRLFFLFFIICFLHACKKSSTVTPSSPNQYEYNFSTGSEGWKGDFADYPNQPYVQQVYAFEFSHSRLPEPLNATDGALKQSGINRSDDLFMFIKKKVSGLEPGKTYSVDIKVDFATNVAKNTVGIGGAPGESVYIKAGAVSIEPQKVLDSKENYFRMNIDKNNQSQSGEDMKVIGNFANGTDVNIYTIKQLITTMPLIVRANPQGEIWLVIGTDSGFEGKTTIYYNSIKATIK
jgi:hypothetical protein